MVHRADVLLREELREEPHHHLAVLEHVRDPRGRAQVVLEDVVLAVGVLHDVDAGDVRIHPARHVHADHLAAELRVAVHLVGGDLAGLHDLLPVIDVVEEPVERLHALAHPARERVPLRARDDVGNDVERNQAFGARGLAVDRERDADAMEEEVRGVAVLRDARGRRLPQPFGERLVVRAHRAAGVVHLVVDSVRHSPNIKQKKKPARAVRSRTGLDVRDDR